MAVEITAQKRRIPVVPEGGECKDSQTVLHDCNRKHQESQQDLSSTRPKKKMSEYQGCHQQD